MWGKKRLAAEVAVKRLAGIAPEVDLLVPPLSVNREIHRDFDNQRRHH